MKIPEFICSVLKNDLQKHGPPGDLFQFRMAPEGRKSSENIFNHTGKHKNSAVMITLWETGNQLKTLLIQRKIYIGAHSGQISFPGGKFEDHEQNPIEVALRETYEEVGIKPESIEIIGNLSPLYIPASHFMVYPVIGYIHQQPEFSLQEREVESIIQLPVSTFLEPKTVQSTRIVLSNGWKINTPFYAIENHMVWGATAMIMSEFTELIQRNGYQADI
jgi:8-oxo-dGTP pyrophosphatase MutT (NUDIX family)